MHLTAQQEYAADPEKVAAMLTNPDFLESVCVASDALSHSVAIEGNHTTTTRTLEAPAAGAKFTGPTLTIVEDVVWSEAAADGSRTGALHLTIAGLPVDLTGTAALAPTGSGTRIDIEADYSVNIPFVGKKLEQTSAPAIMQGINLQQRVGTEWLATH